MNSARLAIEAVSFAYPHTGWKLHPVTLSPEPGRVLGIIGPNGSGKTTLLKLAAGIEKPASGRVLLDGADLHRLDSRRRARILGYLPQKCVTYLDFSVEETVALGRFAHGRGAGFLTREDRRVVDDALSETDLLAFRKRPVSTLSGGERKRALLASVLAQEPSVLLLDEPGAALDLHHQVRLFGLLQRLAERGMTVAVVTHDLNFAAAFTHKVAVMAAGRLEALGAPGDVLSPEFVGRVYGPLLSVTRHPTLGTPVILPAGLPGGAP